MAVLDDYQRLLGGEADVGTGMPLSLDRSTPPDNWTGTALQQLLGKIGDIGTGAAGLVERAQLGAMNALGMRDGGDIYRSKLPVAPGLQAAGDAATFATGALPSPLAPAAGAIRQGLRWAAPAARQTAREATAAFPGLLADEGGALRLTPPRGPIVSPYIGKGTDAPLFDLSRLTERPNVPQTPIDRMPPPAKGIPDWLQAQVNDPAMREQYKQVLQLGRNVAGDDAALGWWNTFPLRDKTIGELGEAAGDARWRSGMNMWSATSPRHDFPANIRQSSYFENLLAEGRPLPELVKKYSEKNPNAFNMVPTESAPKGYANFPLHIQNIQNLLQPDRITLGNQYPLTNPKPATMAQNLVGNWGQPTIDVRDLRAMGLKNKSGAALQSVDPASTYGYIESNFHQPLARDLGFAPAQMQSSTWLGVPEYFQGFDRSGLTPALGTFEDSIRRTAKAMGLTPEQVFRRGWVNKEFKLLSAGGGGAGVGLLGDGVNDDDRAAVK